MPNWVFNYVDITGDLEALPRIKEQLARKVEGYEWSEGNIFNFHNIIPFPADKWEEYHREVVYTNGVGWNEVTPHTWYNWNLSNWGTKWNARDVELIEGDFGVLHYSFETAWSPVRDLIKHLSYQYPTLHFTYEYEEEQGWGGIFEYQFGREVKSQTWDIPQSHHDWAVMGRAEMCRCNYDDEQFEDCPKDEGESNE